MDLQGEQPEQEKVIYEVLTGEYQKEYAYRHEEFEKVE
jgi:hypothetical protein